MWSRVVLLAGWRGPEPRCFGAQVWRLPLKRIREASRARPGGTVLVLGDDALTVLDPNCLPRFPPQPYCVVLGVLANGRLANHDAWKSRCHLLPRVALDEGLTEALRIPGRVQIPLSQWVPRVNSLRPEHYKALAALHRCPSVTVKEWALSLGKERHAPDRLWKAVLGLSAADLCNRYVAAYVHHERLRGIPLSHVATSLGYANPQNLRAFLRHRERGAASCVAKNRGISILTP